MRRVCPAAKGILKPSGWVFGSPSTEYVQKLWYFRCSPSVITGDPSPRSARTVSRMAISYRGSRLGSSWSFPAMASISSSGRGMLPIGSVGMVIFFDSTPTALLDRGLVVPASLSRAGHRCSRRCGNAPPRHVVPHLAGGGPPGVGISRCNDRDACYQLDRSSRGSTRARRSVAQTTKCPVLETAALIKRPPNQKLSNDSSLAVAVQQWLAKRPWSTVSASWAGQRHPVRTTPDPGAGRSCAPWPFPRFAEWKP